MNESSEFGLLIDLAKLLKKYGPDTFDRLAKQLTVPQFAERLSQLLSEAAQVARTIPGPSLGSRRKAPSQKEFRSSLVAVGDTDREKGELLLNLYDKLIAKTVLPTAQGLRHFAATAGLNSLEVNSRPKAVVALIEDLRSRPLEELKKFIVDLNTAVESNDRSLENWTRIIMDKDLRTRKVQ